MQIQLKPASECAQQYGVKCIVHGGPGSGKTPLLMTAPNPVMLITEPGTLSLRNCSLPCYEAYTAAEIDNFFMWLKGSNEANAFDTVCVDSISQMAETYLYDAEAKHKHGLQAYGKMAENTFKHLHYLYHAPRKHIVLTAKTYNEEQGGGSKKYKPYFPGKELHAKVPYLYDLILFANRVQIQGKQGEYPVLHTTDSMQFSARDRSGKLSAIEPMDLNTIFYKCMN